jgi:transcriptional regulator with XRE-family HTH domain
LRLGMPQEDPQPELGRVIRELRARHKYSQEELGHRAGIHHVSVSLIESGKVNPTWGNVRRLAEALGVTLAELAAMTEAEH